MIFITLKRVFITLIIFISITLNTNVLAQNNPTPTTPTTPTSQTQTALYEEVKNVIFDNIANIAVFILAPIGVLMIVINIILILWALMSGEQGRVGSKIAAIMIGFIMVVIGLGIATNKDKIFKTATANTSLVRVIN